MNFRQTVVRSFNVLLLISQFLFVTRECHSTQFSNWCTYTVLTPDLTKRARFLEGRLALIQD